MPYLDQFMQQWKAHLTNGLSECGLRYVVTEDGDAVDIQTNSLVCFRWLRTTSQSSTTMDDSRDELAWVMLEQQLSALANKAERGTSNLVSKLYLDERQIQITLNFSYDDEQHIVYVS